MATQSRKIALLVPEDSELWVNAECNVIERIWKEAIGQPEDEWTVFKCCNSEFPSPEDVGKYDLVLICGSRYSCHDSHDWVVKLRELIPVYATRAQKLVGCCFGSQVVAKSLGGTVGSNPSGRFILDCEKVQVSDSLKKYPHLWQAVEGNLPEEDKSLTLWEAHGEQVLELPPGGELLGSSSNTVNELWHVGEKVMGFQFHPEFTGPLMHEKIHSRLKAIGRLSPEEAEVSEQHLLNSGNTSKAVHALIHAFLEKGFVEA